MLPPRPPFDIVRGVFWLIAVVIAFAMAMILGIGVTCEYMVVVKGMTFAECKGFDLRGVWSEVLTTLLVLLNTRRDPPGPPSPPKPPEPKDKP